MGCREGLVGAVPVFRGLRISRRWEVATHLVSLVFGRLRCRWEVFGWYSLVSWAAVEANGGIERYQQKQRWSPVWHVRLERLFGEDVAWLTRWKEGFGLLGLRFWTIGSWDLDCELGWLWVWPAMDLGSWVVLQGTYCWLKV